MPLPFLSGIVMIVVGAIFLIPALVNLVGSLFGAVTWFTFWPWGAKLAVSGIGLLALIAGIAFSYMPEILSPIGIFVAAEETPAVIETPVVDETPASLLPDEPPTLPPTPTEMPTLMPTPLPLPSPTNTPIPVPTLTPTAVVAPTPTPLPGPSGDCDPAIVDAISAANLAQAHYMEGRLTADGLTVAWGGAARAAQDQAEQMMRYQKGGVRSVRDLRAQWTLLECRKAGVVGDHLVKATTQERWTFNANVECAGGMQASMWVDRYPAESYTLIQVEGGWRINIWDIGSAVKETRWRCPS